MRLVKENNHCHWQLLSDVNVKGQDNIWIPKHILFSGRSDQIRSVAHLCPTPCDPMNRSTPGLPVHHQLPEFTQTHVHRVSDTIQPSHPLSSPSPLAPNPSQHQSLFQWINSYSLCYSHYDEKINFLEALLGYHWRAINKVHPSQVYSPYGIWNDFLAVWLVDPGYFWTFYRANHVVYKSRQLTSQSECFVFLSLVALARMFSAVLSRTWL